MSFRYLEPESMSEDNYSCSLNRTAEHCIINFSYIIKLKRTAYSICFFKMLNISSNDRLPEEDSLTFSCKNKPSGNDRLAEEDISTIACNNSIHVAMNFRL